jgi:O-antigen biosynthesis protein WbqP
MVSDNQIEDRCVKASYCNIKYLLDFIFALLLLIILSPAMFAVALLIMLESKGPAIYRQARVGTGGEPFTIFKFRTMRADAPCLSTADMQQQKTIPFTRVGPYLRMTSVDELPQLFNILKGEMSFIGPRPALPSQTDVNMLRETRGVHGVRPGITGLAQVKGRDDLDTETKVSYDEDYCRNMNMGLDIKILAATFLAVFSARGNK